MKSIVLIVHLCTAIDYSPFLKNCQALVVPKKDAQTCEASKKSWSNDPAYKNYFKEKRSEIKPNAWVMVAEPHCENDPEENHVAPAAAPNNIEQIAALSDKT